MSHDAERVKLAVIACAKELGFDAIGVTAPGPSAQRRSRLCEFVAAGRHWDMTWLETRQDERADPARLWADVRTVIALGMNYGPDSDPLAYLERPGNGVISVYAQN